MSSEDEDFFGNRYYVSNRRFLTIVGLWPYQETSKRLSYAFLTTLTITMTIAVQVYALLMSKLDAKRITDLLQIFLPTLVFTCCYLKTLIHMPVVKKIFDHIKSDWQNVSDMDELIAMQTYTDTSRISCYLVTCTFYGNTVFILFPSLACFFLYISGAIDHSELILPVNSEAFLANDIQYLVMLPLQVLMLLVMATIGTAFYATFIVMAQHACLLFNILTIKISQRFRDDTCQFNLASSNTKADDEYQWIINIIKYHDYVVNYVDNCKSLCDGVYIMQLFLALLLVILDFYYIFQILDMVITSTEAVKNSIFVVGNLCMIYATLFIGQRLIDHSIKAYTECRLIPFYELSVETNKLLLLLTTRCMNPCCVSVGGMLVASNELFTKMTKASFSFATVFYNARKAVM